MSAPKLEMELDVYTQQNITMDVAYAAALVVTDSFRKDFIANEFRPAWLRCGNVPMAPYTSLLKLVNFRTTVECQARMMYMNIRRDPKFILYLTRDTTKKSNLPPELFKKLNKKGKYVACGSFILPNYYKTPPKHSGNALIYSIKTLILRIWFKLKDVYAFHSFKNQMLPKPMLDEFNLGSQHCFALETPERMQELLNLEPSQLADAVIPKSMAYSMNCFAIVTDEQGRGLGKTVMDQFLGKFKSDFEITGPPQIPNCPPKFEFFSSPAGVKFYEKYGFKIGAQWPHKQRSGYVLNHTIFYINM